MLIDLVAQQGARLVAFEKSGLLIYLGHPDYLGLRSESGQA